MDDKTQSESKQNDDKDVAPESQPPKPSSGGWGFMQFSFLSDLQKAAAVAAEEISRNAAVVAQTASKGIAELQNEAEDSESSKEDEGTEDSAAEKESDNEDTKLRKSALDRLEKASEDSLLSQGLKAFDSSVENFASGAWSALGNAWRGSTDFVQRLENSAANLSGSSQHDGPGAAGSNASSLLETGRAFTAKGMQVLEYVSKETMDLLINETGIEVEKDKKPGEEQNDEDQLSEEVTFDRCFYIYGGPEQLEELEALSSHYAMLFNRRKVKLSAEHKSIYDGKLKEVQQIFNLSAEIDSNNSDSNKGKTIKRGNEGSSDEMKNLHDSSVGKAAEMAAGFTNTLTGLAANDVVLRTTARLESLHSEGVHRLSEMCCFAVSQLLVFGKSIISRANKTEDEADDDKAHIEWPEDVTAKANIIRVNAQTMIGYVEAVSNSFITGISDVAEAYQAAIKAVTSESQSVVPHASSVQEKANAFSENLRADQTTAVCKIQEGMQFLAHVLISTSMNAA
ncbi:uncharacterized protein HKW66_Vig0251950 [Vigna angularis]|uniref:DUF7798 domain-containing protein n=2 Tax=Phaseolus angularis TaxID=3914 RepID=A0A8T0JMR9_PHAAN|nr:uncharacterized protein LOC108336084 [Vigna angularis]KAG2377211.1 uncharacterized protein HKW66_Vig0251950 [Vigna angularis]BAT98804.1 hypothetical protein VIGAN_10015100 [Vigna angularis var. angularis]